ncbi:MAG: pyruvate kinase [Clostridium sp.]|nr:pyruvate kinase [Clostridium sp.]MCM1444139.1 pyruvate kinase [Candidatus Amulumruptor caecigallinarius]
MGKTKIVVTIGKSTNTKEKMRNLVLEGTDVIKINMDENDYEFCDSVLDTLDEVNKELNTNVAVMLDINANCMKIDLINNNEASLESNSIIRIYSSNILGDETKFSVNYSKIIDDLDIGSIITVDNGSLELSVIEKNYEYLKCKVMKAGTIYSNSIIHVIGIKPSTSFLNEKGKKDILYAINKNIDYIAMSFVNSYEDILEVNDMLIELGNDHIGIISKIETESSVEDIDEIIKVSDGVIIARGDLGVEIPPERIPGIQKSIISKCHMAGKISIVATELIPSMEENLTPTRAEVSDIANAVLDGVDAIILSRETSNGLYPIETINSVEKVITSAEEGIDYMSLLDKAARTEKQDTTGEISYSVATLAYRLKSKAIVCPTISGYTAKKISRFRPNSFIVAISNNIQTVKSLSLYFGVVPVLVSEMKSLDVMIDKSREIAISKLNLEEKDKIIITGGYPFKEVKHTNFIKVEEI